MHHWIGHVVAYPEHGIWVPTLLDMGPGHSSPSPRPGTWVPYPPTTDIWWSSLDTLFNMDLFKLDHVRTSPPSIIYTDIHTHYVSIGKRAVGLQLKGVLVIYVIRGNG